MGDFIKVMQGGNIREKSALLMKPFKNPYLITKIDWQNAHWLPLLGAGRNRPHV